MMQLLYSSPLAATAAALRRNPAALHQGIDEACDRIDAIDLWVHALLPESDRRARLHREADALLARFPDPGDRPALFGVLTAVKDIFHVDGFPTHAGSALPAEALAGPEATCVKRLRRSGALVAGKAVTTEFAYFEPGPTRNPHHLDHTPGGSSSGSAAAVAVGMTPLALGTQTIGSVIRPAAFCGVVGFKPSLGRIDPQGLVFFSRTLDQVGVFTQDVAGAALAASVLCEGWRGLPAGAGLPVLGVPVGPYLEQSEPAARRAFDDQIERLRAAGVTVRETPALADIEAIAARHRRLVFAEFAAEHAALYPAYAARYRPRSAEIIHLGRTVDAIEQAAIRVAALALRRELERAMQAAGIDLWACPAARGPAPRGLESTGDPAMNLPWTQAGLPSITLPAVWSDEGLPLGLQLVGRFAADEALLHGSQRLASLLGLTA